ncbi:MAG: cell division protein [Bacteriophage sp.]|jgi:hypothetical protein|uniref:hypothetical protein n=1 Tax=Klebsiella pneumoniae TaxID=573 RepID=UPI0021FB8051|nr:MAG: cell division protein [Bacteriophage sp.]UVX54438.1 MAG: cell division protein [Bacteriophage sp.]
MPRIDGADQVIAGLEAKIDKLVADNKALREENAQLNDELDAIYAEPQWFSHRGDYLVIVAVVCILAAAGYYVGKLRGWW